MKKRVIFASVIFIFLFLTSYIVGCFFQGIVNLKAAGAAFRMDNIAEYWIGLLKSPIQSIFQMTTQKNPVWIISFLFSLFTAIYVAIKSGDKKFEIEKSYTVHGAARWATEPELHNFLLYREQKDVLDDFYRGVSHERNLNRKK